MNETNPTEPKSIEPNSTEPNSTEPKPIEPKSKKVVGRRVALGLGIICIILVVGLVGAFVYAIPTINDKSNTISSLNTNDTNLQNLLNQFETYLNGNETLLNETQACLQGNITLLNAQITQLQNWLSVNITAYSNYVSDHNYTNEQYSSLQSTILSLQNQISSLDTQISTLQNQISSLDTQLTSLNNIINLADSTVWVDGATVSEPAGNIGISWHDWTFSADYAGYVEIDVSSTTAGAWTQVVYSAYGVSYSVQTNVGTSGAAYFPILPSSNITVGVGNGNALWGTTQTVTITYFY